MPIEKDVLTTGEVAKICNVAPRTVSKWFDSGQLKGYRIPGSKDRRIPMSHLIKFMKAHGIPMDGVMTGRPRVLVVDDEKDVTELLSKHLPDAANYDVRIAANGFQAGIECERFKPHVLLLDVHLAEDELQLTRVVAMSGKLTDTQLASLRSQGFDECLKKPFSIRQVVEAIEKCMAIVH